MAGDPDDLDVEDSQRPQALLSGWRTSPAADHRVEAVVLPARSQSRARMGAAAVDRAEGSPRVANHDSRRVLVLAPRGVRGGRTPRSQGRCTPGGCAGVGAHLLICSPPGTAFSICNPPPIAYPLP